MSIAELKQHKKKLDWILGSVCKNVMPQVLDTTVEFKTHVDVDTLEADISTSLDTVCVSGCLTKFASVVEREVKSSAKKSLLLEVFMKYDLVYDMFDGEDNVYEPDEVKLGKKRTGLFSRSISNICWNYTLKKVNSLEELELELLMSGYMHA